MRVVCFCGTEFVGEGTDDALCPLCSTKATLPKLSDFDVAAMKKSLEDLIASYEKGNTCAE